MRKLYIVIVSIVYFMNLLENTYAESIEINLETAIERALKENLDIKSNELKLKKLNIGRTSSWSVLIPSVSFSSGLNRPITEPSATPLNPNPQTWSLNRSINVSTPLASRLAQNVISVFIPYNEYKAGEITYDELVASTIKNVELAYIDLYIAEKTLGYLNEKYEIAKLKQDEATKAYNRGLMDEYTNLQIQYAALQASIAKDNQSTVYKTQSTQFAYLLNYPSDTEFTLEEKIKELEIDDISEWLEEQDISNNFALKGLELQEKILKQNRLKLMFGFLPLLSLSWNSMYAYNDAPLENSWFDADKWGTDDIGSWGLTLSIPLSEYHPWSTSGSALRKLNQDIKTANISKQQSEVLKKNELQRTRDELRSNMEGLNLQGEAVKIAQRAKELADQAYNNGLMKYVDYQDAQDTLLKAQLDLLQNQANIVKNILSINILLGKKYPNRSK